MATLGPGSDVAAPKTAEGCCKMASPLRRGGFGRAERLACRWRSVHFHKERVGSGHKIEIERKRYLGFGRRLEHQVRPALIPGGKR